MDENHEGWNGAIMERKIFMCAFFDSQALDYEGMLTHVHESME